MFKQCECGFCGTKLTRRTLHSGSKYETPVWYCRNAANKESITARTVSRCVNPYWRMHFLRHISC
ncbi:MAG: recombinase zinc beta ribbon domain-containing protein [Fusicatenibacter saccharivorans]